MAQAKVYVLFCLLVIESHVAQASFKHAVQRRVTLNLLASISIEFWDYEPTLLYSVLYSTSNPIPGFMHDSYIP